MTQIAAHTRKRAAAQARTEADTEGRAQAILTAALAPTATRHAVITSGGEQYLCYASPEIPDAVALERERRLLARLEQLCVSPEEIATVETEVAEENEAFWVAQAVWQSAPEGSPAEKKADRAMMYALAKQLAAGARLNDLTRRCEAREIVALYLTETDRLLVLSADEVWAEYVGCEARTAGLLQSDAAYVREELLIGALMRASETCGYGLACVRLD
ncbi:hypothetical protein [Deinococcus marmoris]|uniref:hypothetical protein n=1 Tax=Deinococcus marmoris TaxID=249408 RepID=UPI00096AA3B1|nr:hypothetical protein [Deinococcus marmoris]